MRALLSIAFVAVALFATFYGAHAALSRPPAAAQGDELTSALSRIAGQISNRRDVAVRCGPTGAPGVLGVVMFYNGRPGREAILAPKICESLGRLKAGQAPTLECTRLGSGQCPPDVVELAWAVSALAHESHHLRGVVDEAAATCYGLQSAALAARGLGASNEYATTLADYTFWNVRPPREYGYYSPECRDGGALDLRPDTTRFPY